MSSAAARGKRCYGTAASGRLAIGWACPGAPSRPRSQPQPPRAAGSLTPHPRRYRPPAVAVVGGMRTILWLLGGLAIGLSALAGTARQPAPPTLTTAQWQADVETFLRQLPEKHANAFHHLTRAEYDAAAAALRARVAGSNPDEILVAMLQIAARIGDGHTYVHMPASTHRLPVQLLPFGADLRVVRATAEAKALLGGGLVKIDGVAGAQIVERVHTVVSHAAREALGRGIIPSRIRVTEVLHGLGVVADQ